VLGSFVAVLFDFGDRILRKAQLFSRRSDVADPLFEHGHHLLIGASAFRHADAGSIASIA
jgi:hypothetical protein